MRRFKKFDDFYTFITGVFNAFQFVTPDQDGYDNFINTITPLLKHCYLNAQFPFQPSNTVFLCFYKGNVVLSDSPLVSTANYKIDFSLKSIIVSNS